MAVFPELPAQLRESFPAMFWNWWQAFRTWLVAFEARLTVIDGGTIPVYADNAAALAGGLAAGKFYKTATGIVMVVY